MSALEQRLGATLLARTTRTQKLTEVGRNYYAHCKLILNQVADAEAGAAAMGNAPKGHLRVNASLWFGSLTLTPLICDYLQRYPEVDIELSLTDRYVDMVDEGYDVAIRIGELKDSSLIARKLAMFEVAICASPAYLASAGTPHTPEDLLHHQCLGFTNWLSQGGWKLLQGQQGTRTVPAPRFRADNGQALRIAATKGIGIVMMPKELLRPDIEAGHLVELMHAHLPPPRPIHVIYPRERQLAPKVSSFTDFLVERMRA